MASRSSDGRRYYFGLIRSTKHRFYDPESPIIAPESEPISETGSLETRSSSGESIANLTSCVFVRFQRNRRIRRTTGNRLTGGDQQMLDIARALVSGPKILLLDELLEGLAPIVVENLFDRRADGPRYA